MNTRSTRRNGEQEVYLAGGSDNFGSLTRPSIRSTKSTESVGGGDGGSKTKSSKDDMMSEDSTNVTAQLSDIVTSKSTSNSKRKGDISKSSKSTPVSKINRKDVRSPDKGQSGSESDNEDENSDDLEHAYSSTRSYMSSPKVADKTRAFLADKFNEIEDSSHGGDGSTVRTRKVKSDHPELGRSFTSFDERREVVHKQQFRKVREKELLLDTKESRAYSDDEAEFKKNEARFKPQPARGNLWIKIFALLASVLVVSLGIWMFALKPSSANTAAEELRVMRAFQDGFRKLQIIFSDQSPNLWQRTQRILELQLRHGSENQQPAIILLTAARDAEQMLHCVGNHLAKTYASALNSSYTVLSGLELTSKDSEGAKLDIDQRLSAGFHANGKAAVLHRLELLPPGSLIILYKYCDHENAAFKNVALVLTVLLKNSTLQSDINLNELEETVYDYFKEMFINQVKPSTSHNEMNGDKLGGVWSRISHVVLPIFPGNSKVKECDESKASL